MALTPVDSASFAERHPFVSEADVMAALPEQDRAFLYGKGFRRKYRKHTIIHSPEDPGVLVHYVLFGRVKIYNVSASGKEIIYRFCHPRSFFGLAELFGGGAREVYAEATEDTEVLCVNRTDFEDILVRNPKFAIAVIRILGTRVRQAHRAIKDFSVSDVRSRVAQIIVKLAQTSSVTRNGVTMLSNRVTHQDLANMIGATRTTITRSLNTLKREGFLSSSAGRIVILDHDALADLVNE